MTEACANCRLPASAHTPPSPAPVPSLELDMLSKFDQSAELSESFASKSN